MSKHDDNLRYLSEACAYLRLADEALSLASLRLRGVEIYPVETKLGSGKLEDAHATLRGAQAIVSQLLGRMSR